MADSKKKPDAKSDVGDVQNKASLEKLKILEEHLEVIEKSKKQKNMVSIVGLLLILLAIAVFVMNLANFAKEKSTDAEFRQELLTTLTRDMKEVQGNPNLQAMLNDLKSEIIPYVSQQIIDRFKKDAPKFQAKGENIANDLQNYLENDVKEKLVKSLSESLLDVEGIIKEKYPDISLEDLRKVIESAQATFVIEITNIIEERLDSVHLDIKALKASVNKFKECEEYMKLDPNHSDTMGHVKLQMVESMLELVIYQMNPRKGKINVEDTFGGVK